jgi:hypothetical protein
MPAVKFTGDLPSRTLGACSKSITPQNHKVGVLAQERHVSSSTQNQALSAILFLYREVLRQPLDHVEVTWAQKPKRLPTVLSQEEANRVLSHLSGVHLLMGLAVHFPFHQTGCGQAGRFAAPPSFARKRITKGGAPGGAESGHQQAGWPAYLPPLLCHPPPRSGLRYPHGTRANGT